MNSGDVAYRGLAAELRFAADQLQHGNAAGAARTVRKRLQEHPRDDAAWYLLGAIALHAGKIIAAEAHFMRAIACTQSRSARAICWNALGHARLARQASRPACAAFWQALRIDPGRFEFAIDYVETLIAVGRASLAARTLTQLARQNSEDSKLWLRLADLMLQCRRPDEASALYAHALRIDPRSAEAHAGRSTALLVLGKSAEARAACEQALSLNPNLAAYNQLATLGGLGTRTQLRANAEQHATGADGASLDAQVDACFALAQVHDRDADYARAFRYLELGNRLKRGTLGFRIHDEAERIDGLTRFFNAQLIERFVGRVESGLKPIFIVGMPRSGTTLLEQMLGAHPCITACGELDYMPEAALRFGAHWSSRLPPPLEADARMVCDLRRATWWYSGRVRRELGCTAWFTDKMPANFLFLGLIHFMFPHAVILHVRRNPMDTCLSCYQHLFPGHAPFTYDLQELGQYFRLYTRLMQHWGEVLPKNRFLNVEYEALVDNPEDGIRRVLEYCGLPFDDRCLNPAAVQRPVLTLSATQVRQPIYRTSVDHWRHYAEYLGSLRMALEMRV